jgi:hypothetical protein
MGITLLSDLTPFGGAFVSHVIRASFPLYIDRESRLQKAPTQKFRDLTRKIISITQFPVYEATHSNVHKAELDGEPVGLFLHGSIF